MRGGVPGQSAWIGIEFVAHMLSLQIQQKHGTEPSPSALRIIKDFLKAQVTPNVPYIYVTTDMNTNIPRF